MQVDYATSCHNPLLSVFEKLSSAVRLRPFLSYKYPYPKNPYVQSVRSLSPRKGNSHFETSKLQVVDSAHIQENQPPLIELTARVLFSKTTNINLASPTSTFSHLHSDDVHAVGGLSDFTTRGPFLESSDNFSGPKSCSMFAVFAFKMSLNNFENNKVKLSVNEAKLAGF